MLTDFTHQVVYRVVNHVEIFFEAVGTAVIRIGHIEIGIFFAERQQPADFAFVRGGRAGVCVWECVFQSVCGCVFDRSDNYLRVRKNGALHTGTRPNSGIADGTYRQNACCLDILFAMKAAAV